MKEKTIEYDEETLESEETYEGDDPRCDEEYSHRLRENWGGNGRGNN